VLAVSALALFSVSLRYAPVPPTTPSETLDSGHADACMTGVAADGKAIVCEDNNGLRREPA